MCAETALLTVGIISQRLGIPVSRVEYILRTRRDIKPVGCAGNARVYSEADLELIHSIVRRIDREKGVANVGE